MQKSFLHKKVAILNLDKVVFSKPYEGVRCGYCGGYLRETLHPKIFAKLLAQFTLGKIKLGHYQCKNCNKRFTIL